MDDQNNAESGGQLQLDFKDRDELLASLCLPKSTTVPDGKTVSAKIMKAVLFRIHQHSGNFDEAFVGVERIALAIGADERTVRRANAALEKLGLLNVEFKKSKRSKCVVNHYTIMWDGVLKLQPNRYQGHPETNASTERSDISDVKTESMETTDCPESDRTFPKSDRTFPTTDRTFSSSDRTFSATNRTLDVHRHSKTLEDKTDNKDSKGPDGVLKNCGGIGGTLGVAFEAADLNQPERIQELWENAIERNVLPDDPYWRETFFGLCHSIYRNRKAFKDPAKMLQHKLRSGAKAILEQVDDAHDRTWGRDAIRKNDYPPELIKKSPRPQWTQSPDVLDSLDREQLAALLARAPRPVREHHRRHGLARSIRPTLLALLMEPVESMERKEGQCLDSMTNAMN